MVAMDALLLYCSIYLPFANAIKVKKAKQPVPVHTIRTIAATEHIYNCINNKKKPTTYANIAKCGRNGSTS